MGGCGEKAAYDARDGFVDTALIGEPEKYSKSAMSASPQDSPDSEKMVKIMCRTVACGMFEYPASKIEWLKAKMVIILRLAV